MYSTEPAVRRVDAALLLLRLLAAGRRWRRRRGFRRVAGARLGEQAFALEVGIELQRLGVRKAISFFVHGVPRRLEIAKHARHRRRRHLGGGRRVARLEAPLARLLRRVGLGARPTESALLERQRAARFDGGRLFRPFDVSFNSSINIIPSQAGLTSAP
ncbi:hypothetical protein M885DRAFT_509719 [Pelagophyceae sp. CCMP2097]|nr:hypothetical protein M885DRAFT_509719 [Pelagophyceae sp. CCMP2097]